MLCIFALLLIIIVPKVVAGQGGSALGEFSDALTGELYYENDAANDCTSVWGVSMLFDLLRPGTDDTIALEQICDVIGVCSGGDDSSTDHLLWEDAVARLEAEYDGSCSARDEQYCKDDGEAYRPLLLIANSVWVDDTSELVQEYNETVEELVHQIDFQKEDAGDIVNAWVNQSTLGLIDSIIDEGPIDFDLVAVNTIYLKAAWYNQFDEEVTSREVFHVDESTTIEAHFMHLVIDSGFAYSHSALEGYQVLKLNFQATSSLSMVFVLPLLDDLSGKWKQAEHTEMLQSLPSNDIKAALGNLEWGNQVAVAIPKFKYKSIYEEDLKTALTSLGLIAPFRPVNSVFCSMLMNVCMFIDLIVQKTSIDVNEKGVEAAAATAAGIIVTSVQTPPPEIVPPALFQADRPFKFFIYNEGEDVFLFEGFVSEPNIPEGSSALYEGSHDDDGFWTQSFFATGLTPVQPTKFGSVQPLPSCGSNLWLFLLQILFGWNIGWLFGFSFCLF